MGRTAPLSLLLLLLALTTSCGLVKQTRGLQQCESRSAISRLATGDSAFTSFKADAHPPLNANCGACHSSAAALAPGKFGDRDAATAYLEASKRMNFSDVVNSRLYIKGTDGHCGQCDAARNKAAFESALRKWAEAELLAASGGECSSATPTPDVNPTPTPGGGDPYANVTFSALVNLPANLTTTATTFARVRIPLDALGFTGSLLELGVLKYTNEVGSAPASYLFAEPRIYARNSPIYVSGMHLYLKSGERRNTGVGFIGLDAAVAQAPANFNLATVPLAVPSLSTDSELLNGFLGTTPQIQVSFDVILGDLATASEPLIFKSLASPVLTQRCGNCHNANRNFDLSGDIDSDRLNALDYVSKGDGANSVLLRYGRDGANGHGGGSPLNGRTAEINAILTWINKLP